MSLLRLLIVLAVAVGLVVAFVGGSPFQRLVIVIGAALVGFVWSAVAWGSEHPDSGSTWNYW